MKKLLYLLATIVVALSACNKKSDSTSTNALNQPEDSLVMLYDDDLVSAMLPQGWTWQTDTCETWHIRNIIDSLNITSGIVEFFPPDNSFKIRIVKSTSRWLMPDNPVSDWANIIYMRADGDSSCIYAGEVMDSLQIDGHDACGVWTAYTAGTDTMIQDEYIVIKDKYDLYYLSGIFSYGDEHSLALWHKILDTVKLK